MQHEFLVGAFREKNVFFFGTKELSEIVLPKVLAFKFRRVPFGNLHTTFEQESSNNYTTTITQPIPYLTQTGNTN